MNARNTPNIVYQMLIELENLDAEMVQADQALKKATADYQIVGTKLASVRDMLRRHGQDPYALGHPPYWNITRSGEGKKVELPSRGAFQFLRMVPAEAIQLALTQLNQPYGVEDLSRLLSDGGAKWANPSAVQTLLTNKLRETVGKTTDGKYYLLSQFQPEMSGGGESDEDDDDED